MNVVLRRLKEERRKKKEEDDFLGHPYALHSRTVAFSSAIALLFLSQNYVPV